MLKMEMMPICHCDFNFSNNVSSVLFIPYAKRNHDEYLRLAQKPFKKWGFNITSIHTQNPHKAIQEAKAIFVGGGNSFRLLKTLYDLDLVKMLNKRVLEEGVPYIGTSAGKVFEVRERPFRSYNCNMIKKNVTTAVCIYVKEVFFDILVGIFLVPHFKFCSYNHLASLVKTMKPCDDSKNWFCESWHLGQKHHIE
nr:unnamed protein product [Callosobruchus analis]